MSSGGGHRVTGPLSWAGGTCWEQSEFTEIFSSRFGFLEEDGNFKALGGDEEGDFDNSLWG